MELTENEIKILLTEYKETSENLRERHRTIWFVRSVFMVTVTAFVSYVISMEISNIFIFSFLGLMFALMVGFDIKYQRAKIVLEDSAIRIGEKLNILTQYTESRKKRKIPYWLQFTAQYIVLYTSLFIWYYSLSF